MYVSLSSTKVQTYYRNHKKTYTIAFCIASPSQTISFSAESLVSFRALEAEEVSYYVEKYRPMDKAGAYGIQEWIGYIGIEGIEGSFYNVMGLPVQRLYQALKELL